MKIAVFTSAEDLVPFRGHTSFPAAIAKHAVDFEVVDETSRARALREAEVFIVARMPRELIDGAENLRWVNFWTSGLDTRALPFLTARNIRITNSSGVHAPKIAAHMMACILMFACRMPFFQRAQLEKAWKQEDRGFDDLTGRTLGIAGLGRIGEALAVRARAFGMRIVASKRDVSRRYDPSIPIDRIYSPEQLPEMAAECDHLCLTLRYTEATHHLFDKAMLARMKPSAFLYNTARGRIVDEQALIEALRAGRLAGAGLDVFEEEPLSSKSALWDMENVVLTPHVAGFNPHYFSRAATIFADNLERYLDGRPMLNLYDPERGY